MSQRISPHILPGRRRRRIALRHPRTLQPPHLDLNLHPRIQPRRRNPQRIHLPRRKKLHRRAPQAPIQKHLQKTPINNALEPKRSRIGIDQVRDGELVREEGVVEAGDVAAVDPEGGVAAEVEAAAQGLARGGGEEGEVRGAGGVCGGDVAGGKGEVEGSGGDGGAVIEQQARVG